MPMSPNSFFGKFRELYEQQVDIAEKLRLLAVDARDAGIADIITIKRLARLVASEKLSEEKKKFEKLARAVEECGQADLFR